ncbi:MAG: hypothetical protein JSV80_17945 [Acidobacteriota bacterium]|nr:MAG: hypothetical protein JSV80_17945 [Acidobacteriota bacterium]
MPRPPRRRRSRSWRRLLVAIHRDVGYSVAALTIVYAVSGIAVNHMHDWNPNYKLARESRRFDPVETSGRDTIVAALVERLDLPGPPVNSFRRSPEKIELFYDGWSISADAASGTAIVERPRERLLLRDFNFLHLNHAKGIWTWLADVYALALLALAVSGVVILRGPQGLAGRGKWFLLGGALVPLVILLFLRYL